MGLLSALFRRKPRNALEALQANPIFQQYKALADATEPLCASGVDADELPNGRGEFGLTATNPVPCKTVLGATAYMGRLRAPDGAKVRYERLGSVQSDVSPMPIDVYEVRHPNGAALGQVYVSAYQRRISSRAPKGFQLAEHSFAAVTSTAEEFATVAQTETADFTLPAGTLKYLLSMVHFAMAQQDVRYYLNGMLLVVDGTTVRAVATNGHRLAMCEVHKVGGSAKIEAIIPRKAIVELARLMPDGEDPVRVQFAAKQVKFGFAEIELSSKLVDGNFPDYQRVIPQANSKTFVIDREDLMHALQRAASLTTDEFKRVHLELAPGRLKINSTNTDQEELEIDYVGDGLDIIFNVNYLLDVLTNVKSAKLKFALSNAQGAALITLPDSDKFKCVVMPIK